MKKYLLSDTQQNLGSGVAAALLGSAQLRSAPPHLPGLPLLEGSFSDTLCLKRHAVVTGRQGDMARRSHLSGNRHEFTGASHPLHH